MKLNEITRTCNITVFGFPAFKELEDMGNKTGNQAVISTLPAAVMLHIYDIGEYFAPIIPRGTIFRSTSEIIEADLDVNHVSVFPAPGLDTYGPDELLIVTQHKATIDVLSGMHPGAPVITASVSADDIRDKVVVGVLPPHLIQFCKAFSVATIKDYNVAVDGDISADDLGDRLEVMSPITVKINREGRSMIWNGEK